MRNENFGKCEKIYTEKIAKIDTHMIWLYNLDKIVILQEKNQ